MRASRKPPWQAFLKTDNENLEAARYFESRFETMKRWFYKLLGEEFGPVPFDELSEMRSSGTLSDSDEVREDGSEDWLNLADVLSQASDSVATANDASDTDLPDIDLFQFESASETSARTADSSASELSIDDFQIANEEPIPDQQRNSPPPEKEYYVDSLGQVLGPMPIEELRSMASSGALTEGDKVREGETGEWGSPFEFPQISVALTEAARNGQGEGAQMTSTTARRLSTAADSSSPATEPTEEVSAANQTEASEEEADDAPASKSALPKKKEKEKKKPAGKKQKKKKQPKKDEFLQEIFSEVFTEDGKVREDRSATDENATPSQTPSQPLPLPTPPAASPSSALPPSAADATQLPATAPPTPAMAKPRPAIPTKPQRKSGGGISLPQIDGKTWGIVGGVLAAVLILGVVFDFIPLLPGPDVDDYLARYEKQYLAIAENPASPAWLAFKTNASKDGKVILDYFKAKGRLSPHGNNQRWSVRAMVNLANCDPEDSDTRDKRYTDLVTMMNKLK